VEDAAISGLTVEGNPEAESVIRFMDTKDVLMTATRAIGKAGLFIQVEGRESGGIVVEGGDLSKADRVVGFAAGAVETAVRVRQ
jgi:hypothetical protein